MKRTIVVDAFTTGRYLPEALRERGVEVRHIMSKQPSDYFAEEQIDPHSQVWQNNSTVLMELKEWSADSVVAGSETGVELADYLASTLNLDGNDPRTSIVRRDKAELHKTLRDANVATPRSVVVTSAALAVQMIEEAHLCLPLIVKPARSAGSDRVRRCSTRQAVDLAITDALADTNLFGERTNGMVVIQEFLEGVEFAVNTVSKNGSHFICEIWRHNKRIIDNRPVYDVEHAIPIESVNEELIEYVKLILDTVGVRYGAAHLELFVTERGPVLIDFGARLSGGMLPQVTESFFGASQFTALVNLLCAGELPAPQLQGSIHQDLAIKNLIFPYEKGYFTPTANERISHLSSVVGMHLNKSSLKRTVDLPSSPGYVYLAGPTEKVADDIETLRQWEACCDDPDSLFANMAEANATAC